MIKVTNLFIMVLLTLLAVSCDKDKMINPSTESEDSAPNILLIIADDMGVDVTPAYDQAGVIKPSMPQLNALMDDGITFDNVWANPVCSPTRAAIISGKYGYRTAVLNPEEDSNISSSETSIQAYITENATTNYANALIGKWHLSRNINTINALGIAHFSGIIGGGVDDYYSYNWTKDGVSQNESEYITSKITNEAIDWISTQDQPWFCWVAYNAPHSPLHVPPDELHQQGSLQNDEPAITDNPLPYYLAMIEAMDTEMGRLLQSIPADELDNTVIIFIGDNGTPRNVLQQPYDPGQNKGSLFQGGVHVPMVVSGHIKGAKGTRHDALIGAADLFATIAELAEINLSQYQDSYSFESIINDFGSTERQYNYAEVSNTDQPNRSGFTIRDERYKLIQFDNDLMLFYDLEIDPFEKQDLLTLDELSLNESDALAELMSEASKIRN